MMEVAARYISSGEVVKDVNRAKSVSLNPPSTPPQGQFSDLPTPPTSHIEMSASTLPPSSAQSHGMSAAINDRRSPSPVQTPSTSGFPVEHSPSFDAQRRKTKRLSGGRPGSMSGHLNDDIEDEGEEEGTRRGRRRIEDDTAGPSYSRSRTPSPILGSIVSQTGKLSFSAALQPSAEEVRSLLYGENNEDDKEEARPRSVGHEEMDSLLKQLDSMGLAVGGDETQQSREQKLASMVKRLVDHARKQDAYIDGMEASLHNTRLRSIAMLSSVRTQFAHSFATEYELRARLQAELDGVKAQARKLSQLLAHSETRNEELDRERAASAEEEVIWQEEMKDHASAYAQQRAARARAAHLAQQAQPALPTGDVVKQERPHPDGRTDSDALLAGALSSSPPLPTSGGLEEPFEERKAANGPISALPQSHSEGSLAGLGISAAGAVQIDAPVGSPLSTIIKERNKLLADKRYLRIRIRDSEAQRERLELELKSLRPLLVRGVPSKTSVAAQLTATPTTPGRSQKRDRSRRRRQAMMGDAEAEHLLLAARRLQNTKRAVDEDGRPTTPPPMSGANPRTPRTPKVAQTPRSGVATDSVVMQSGASSSRDVDSQPVAATALDASPLAGRTGVASLGRWGRHERVDSNRSAGGGIDELLHAAQTVLTPGERVRQSGRAAALMRHGGESDGDDDIDDTLRGPHRSQERGAFGASSVDESPKRRRVNSATPGRGRRGSMLSMSPDKALFVASRRVRTQTEGAEPPHHSHDFIPPASQASALSALDLLADQAAASQVPSQSSEQSNSGEGEAFNGRSDDSDDGMNVDRQTAGPNGTPHMGHAHYYPRGSYGHVYAATSHQHPHHMHPSHHGQAPGGPQHPPLAHEAYRMSGPPMSNGAPYGYGPPIGSPVAINAHGWTSQNVPPPGRNGSIYSPPTSHHARFLQSGPRISTGYVATGMQPDGHGMPPANRLAKGHAHRLSNGGDLSYEEDDDDVSVGGTQRTPQKGGNTSPDKRLPYVRWSEEEDQKLRRAIGEFGQRWESVARVVGTRTYHQCRQRYLLMRRKEAAAREGGEDVSS